MAEEKIIKKLHESISRNALFNFLFIIENQNKICSVFESENFKHPDKKITINPFIIEPDNEISYIKKLDIALIDCIIKRLIVEEKENDIITTCLISSIYRIFVLERYVKFRKVICEILEIDDIKKLIEEEQNDFLKKYLIDNKPDVFNCLLMAVYGINSDFIEKFVKVYLFSENSEEFFDKCSYFKYSKNRSNPEYNFSNLKNLIMFLNLYFTRSYILFDDFDYVFSCSKDWAQKERFVNKVKLLTNYLSQRKITVIFNLSKVHYDQICSIADNELLAHLNLPNEIRF